MIYLTKVNFSRDMSRFYTLDVRKTLFGEWVLIREWGRIGQAGQTRRRYYAEQDDVAAALSMALRRRRKRGYVERTGLTAGKDVCVAWTVFHVGRVCSGETERLKMA